MNEVVGVGQGAPAQTSVQQARKQNPKGGERRMRSWHRLGDAWRRFPAFPRLTQPSRPSREAGAVVSLKARKAPYKSLSR